MPGAAGTADREKGGEKGEKMNDKQDFTRGNIPAKMIQFMFPILGALILQAMYSGWIC